MQQPWITRRFSFPFPVEQIGVLLSRLRGAPVRIREAVRGLDAAQLTARPGEAWSIQEHVGHLHELEHLHLRRLDELEAGAAVLSAADMRNRATWDGRYNERPFADVLAAFVDSRARLVDRLAALDADGLARAARHPRLDQPMRAVDVAFFTAEHDDHHVATIERLAAAAR